MVQSFNQVSKIKRCCLWLIHNPQLAVCSLLKSKPVTDAFWQEELLMPFTNDTVVGVININAVAFFVAADETLEKAIKFVGAKLSLAA